MGYTSIDTLQKALSEQVFAHSKDSKKAAGRALGSIVEIITYYLLREWQLGECVSIERGISEYGNPSISHNVEFTLHPLFHIEKTTVDNNLPITATKILNRLELAGLTKKKSAVLADREHAIRNACTIAESDDSFLVASMEHFSDSVVDVSVFMQHRHPFAMFECKRVGVEEGNKKGPQTIEKAKQGAYVAQYISSLQKVRNKQGERFGLVYDEDGNPIIQPYAELLQTIVHGDDTRLLKDFTLTVGIVSNHCNWFTSGNLSKELRVLGQSYDWLLFLSDNGLTQFVSELILDPQKEYLEVRRAFLNSYKEGKKRNCFTKTIMDIGAHTALCNYFSRNIAVIESWFNIIAPKEKSVEQLKQMLFSLKGKNWKEIL